MRSRIQDQVKIDLDPDPGKFKKKFQLIFHSLQGLNSLN